MGPLILREAENLARGGESVMLAERAGCRRIQTVPALLVSLLQDAGKLPSVPREPDRNGVGFRPPGLAEMQALTWIALWQGERTDEMGFRQVAGLLAYRDGYDFHNASDCREIVYLAGSPRASIELLRWLRDSAKEDGRRALGSFDVDNVSLKGALERIGGREKRIVVEAICQG